MSTADKIWSKMDFSNPIAKEAFNNLEMAVTTAYCTTHTCSAGCNTYFCPTRLTP